MSKKKKDEPYDGAEEQGTTLDDFIIYARVDAFDDAYQPCAENMATNTFTETKLRDFFKAWPCNLGDPLNIYLEMLKTKGFKLQVASGTGDLAIFVRENNVSSKLLEFT